MDTLSHIIYIYICGQDISKKNNTEDIAQNTV